MVGSSVERVLRSAASTSTGAGLEGEREHTHRLAAARDRCAPPRLQPTSVRSTARRGAGGRRRTVGPQGGREWSSPDTLAVDCTQGGSQRPYSLEQLTTSGMQPTMPSPSPSPPPGYVIVATGGAGVNLRTGPSTTGPIITTLAEGTPIEIVGDPVSAEGRSWRQIRGGGREGWVVSVVVRQR
jgi:hypothetical protein